MSDKRCKQRLHRHPTAPSWCTRRRRLPLALGKSPSRTPHDTAFLPPAQPPVPASPSGLQSPTPPSRNTPTPKEKGSRRLELVPGGSTSECHPWYSSLPFLSRTRSNAVPFQDWFGARQTRSSSEPAPHPGDRRQRLRSGDSGVLSSLPVGLVLGCQRSERSGDLRAPAGCGGTESQSWL